jgi:hypothetical protein
MARFDDGGRIKSPWPRSALAGASAGFGAALHSPHAARAASAAAGSALSRYTVGRSTPVDLAIWAMLTVPLVRDRGHGNHCSKHCGET